MTVNLKPWLARFRALRPRPGFLAEPRSRRRSVVAVLLLAAWLLPFLVPPRSAASSLPDCCQGDGAHKCFLRQALNAAGAPVEVMTVPCDAPSPKVAASATNLTALHTTRPPAKALCLAPCEALPVPVDRVPAPVFGVRSSRAPPRLV